MHAIIGQTTITHSYVYRAITTGGLERLDLFCIKGDREDWCGWALTETEARARIQELRA